MGIFKGLKKKKGRSVEDAKLCAAGDKLSNQAQKQRNVIIETEIESVSLGKNPNEYDIRNYVDSNCSKMLAAENENKEFRREYEKVTGYLKDIESIENMVPERKIKLISVASEIVEITNIQKKTSKHSGTISSQQYKAMQQYEDVMNGELMSLKRKEKYQMDIKSDMRHLEAEKAGLLYEQKHRYKKHGFYKTISIGMGFIIISLMALFGVIAIYSDVDMTMAFIALIAAAGAVILYIFMSVRNNRYGVELTGRKINKAINLLNSAKIKYINTTALLDYLYSKYSVESAAQLEYVWGQYLRIKSEEEKLREAKERKEELENMLLMMLKEEGISDTNVWTSQVVALIESREMVEVRHKLNVRRGKLREQIAYNDDIYNQAVARLSMLVKGNPKAKDVIEQAAKSRGVLSDIFNVK